MLELVKTVRTTTERTHLMNTLYLGLWGKGLGRCFSNYNERMWRKQKWTNIEKGFHVSFISMLFFKVSMFQLQFNVFFCRNWRWSWWQLMTRKARFTKISGESLSLHTTIEELTVGHCIFPSVPLTVSQ